MVSSLQFAVWGENTPLYLFHKMGVGRIRRVNCGFVTEARKGRGGVRKGGGSGNSMSLSPHVSLASASGLGWKDVEKQKRVFCYFSVWEVEWQCTA